MNENGEARELEHLQHPIRDNLNYDYYFRDESSIANENTFARRPLAPSANRSTPRSNKRKLCSADLSPRSVLNLRHRKVSDETTDWLASYNCDISSLTKTDTHDHTDTHAQTYTHAVSDTDENDESCLSQKPDSAFSSDPLTEDNDDSLKDNVTREPLEELWLGPVFDSSQTVLKAITSLPVSVTHLDLDLRNALHLLPQAMPLLFGKHQLKTLSLRVFGDAGAIELSKWMNQNPNLERLDLRGNRIGSTGARTIFDAIMACGNDSTNLSHLNLGCNCIINGDKIGDLLASNKTLEVLDLGFNWLGDQGVEDIFTGLDKNTTLRDLNLCGCHRISNKGLKAILRCLQLHNTSLHTIGLQAFDEEGERIIEEIKYWLKLNKAGRFLIKSSLPGSSMSLEQDHQCNSSSGAHPSLNGLRRGAPIALWSHALEKSNNDPDSIFHLIREGFGAKILDYR